MARSAACRRCFRVTGARASHIFPGVSVSRRFDVMPAAQFFQGRPLTRLPTGVVRADCVCTTTGVFPYIRQRADGSTYTSWELRHPDQVLSPASLSTVDGAVVTLGHTDDGVNPKNITKVSKGTLDSDVEGAWRESEKKGYVRVSLKVLDQEVADLLEQAQKESSNVEVSMGYTADIVERSGVWNGVAFDAEQTNIKYFELAIVDRGRMNYDLGDKPRVKVLLGDSLDDGVSSRDPSLKPRKEGVMPTIQQDGAPKAVTVTIPVRGKAGVTRSFDATPELAAALAEFMGQEQQEPQHVGPAQPDPAMATLAQQVQALTQRLAACEQGLMGKADKEPAEQRQPDESGEKPEEEAAPKPGEKTGDGKRAQRVTAADTAKQVAARVADRLALERAAQSAQLSKDVLEKLPTLDDRSIMAAVIVDRFPSFKPDGLTLDQLKPTFGLACSMPPRAAVGTPGAPPVRTGDSAGGGDAAKRYYDSWDKPPQAAAR